MAKPPIFTSDNARFLNPVAGFLNPIADRIHYEEDMKWWEALKEFAASEHSSENIDFYFQTIGIENLVEDPSTRSGAEERLQGIIKEFVNEDSKRPINISAPVRSRFNNATTIDEKATAVVRMRDEIQGLIQNQIMQRFLISDKYRKTAENMDMTLGTQYVQRARRGGVSTQSGTNLVGRSEEPGARKVLNSDS